MGKYISMRRERRNSFSQTTSLNSFITDKLPYLIPLKIKYAFKESGKQWKGTAVNGLRYPLIPLSYFYSIVLH